MTIHCVLLADDEPELLSQAEKVFRESGFVVVCCKNGLEAWDQLLQHADEIVACVVDMQMPPGQYGGRDLVTRIRNAFSKDLPIVVYSGRGTVSLSHEVTKAGASAFVEKEQGVLRLLDTVTALLATSTPAANPQNSSLQELAKRTDLPHLAIMAFGKLERQIRSILSEAFAPDEVCQLMSANQRSPRRDLLDKLKGITSFSGEAKLSMGDLLEILAGLAMLQTISLPSPKSIRSSAENIVTVRNDLSHGREVEPRRLVLALMSADDLAKQLSKAPLR